MGFRPITPDEVAEDSTASVSDGYSPKISQVGKGLTFGFFDELQGLEAGASNSIANLFGRGNDQGFWGNYDATVKNIREKDQKYEKENPWTSAGLQLSGGVLPAVASGGASLLGLGSSAVKTSTPTLLKYLYGIGLKEAPTVGQLATIGATGGALAGAGEANDGSRLLGAGIGGVAGGVISPIVGKGLGYASNSLLDFLADKGVTNKLASQTGAIGNLGSPKVPYTPEELVLARQLKNTPITNIDNALTELSQTTSSDIPLFLPEAVKSPKVDRNARFIANFEPSLEYSQNAIKQRTEGATERAASLLDLLSPEKSPFEGAKSLVTGASDIIEGAKNQRKAIADPAYKMAYQEVPLIQSEDLTTLLEKDKVLSQAISSIKKTANNADLPENSSSLLVKARQEIGNKIENAITQGRGREAADLTDTYNRLNNILHEANPLLKKADEGFAVASKEIEALNDTFLSSLSKISDDKVKNIGQLFNLSPERISGLKTQFQKAGKIGEWEAGVRAYIQNVVDGVTDNADFTKKLISNESSRNKLKAALGDKAEGIIEGLKLEQRMFEGKNRYFTGSSTQTNLEEAQSTKGFIQKIKGLVSVDGLLSAVFKDGLPDDVAKGLAKIYFDPKSGLNSLEKIKPLLKSYAKNKIIASNISSGAGSASLKTSLSNDLLNSNTAESFTSKSSQKVQPQTSLKTNLSALESSKTQGQKIPKLASPSIQKELPKGFSAIEPETIPTKSRGTVSPSIESIQEDLPYKNTSYDDTETTPYNFIDLALNRAISQIDDADLQKTLPKGKKMTGDIDLDALKQSVIKQESAGNAKAVSPKGAQGLMQLMPATGKELAKEIGVKYDPYDAEQNQELGMLYLTKQLKTFGSMELALAAYNAGPARVKDWQRKYGTTWRQIEQALLKRGSFKETTDYVNKIKKNYELKAKKSTGAIEI